MDSRPNIVIFNPDQWRGDVLGHLGNPAAVTPNIDRIVSEDAVSFRWAFCQNPVCTPSRCSFMTGWYPHTRGHRTMHYMLHPEHGEPNLLHILKRNGYYVWWGGKNDLAPGQDGSYRYTNKMYYGINKYAKNLKKVYKQIQCFPRDWRGPPDGDNYFSFYVGKVKTEENSEFYTPDCAFVDGAVDFIKKYKKSKPFCVYLPLVFPHPQYMVDDPWFNMISREKLPARIPKPAIDQLANHPKILQGIREAQHLEGWTEDRWNELRACYYGMCAKIDDLFGRLIASLKEAGQYENTLIFFFSDHGDFMGDYGLVEKNQNTFQDCLSRVPFIIKPPKNWNCQPRVSDAMVELVDLVGTIYETTDISPGYTHFSRSLVQLLKRNGEALTQPEEHRDAVFCEGGRLIGERQAMELESKSALKPDNLYFPRIHLQTTDEYPYHGKAAMCRTKTHKYVQRLYEKGELYDLRTDPGEIHNCIDNPAYQDVLADLRFRQLRWYQETCDFVPNKTDVRVFLPNFFAWVKNLFKK